MAKKKRLPRSSKCVWRAVFGSNGKKKATLISGPGGRFKVSQYKGTYSIFKKEGGAWYRHRKFGGEYSATMTAWEEAGCSKRKA